MKEKGIRSGTAGFAAFLLAIVMTLFFSTQFTLTAYAEPAPPADDPGAALPASDQTPPLITTQSLPYTTVGAVYYAGIEATGAQPITWSAIKAQLPLGLDLSASGGALALSGTPVTPGAFTFDITATNAFGTDVKTYTVNVDPLPPVEWQPEVETPRIENAPSDKFNIIDDITKVDKDKKDKDKKDNKDSDKASAASSSGSSGTASTGASSSDSTVVVTGTNTGDGRSGDEEPGDTAEGEEGAPDVTAPVPETSIGDNKTPLGVNPLDDGSESAYTVDAAKWPIFAGILILVGILVFIAQLIVRRLRSGSRG